MTRITMVRLTKNCNVLHEQQYPREPRSLHSEFKILRWWKLFLKIFSTSEEIKNFQLSVEDSRGVFNLIFTLVDFPPNISPVFSDITIIIVFIIFTMMITRRLICRSRLEGRSASARTCWARLSTPETSLLTWILIVLTVIVTYHSFLHFTVSCKKNGRQSCRLPKLLMYYDTM